MTRMRVPKIKIAKVYLAEAALIVFSVLLALSLNELRNYWMEKRQTKQIMNNIKAEIFKNQQAVKDLVMYHDSVVHMIDSAIVHESFSRQLISKRGFDFFLLAPKGVYPQNINNTSWEVAKNSNIALKVNFNTSVLLTELYNQQDIVKEAYTAALAIYNSRESYEEENVRKTLIMLRRAFNEIKGRESGLLYLYEKVLKELEQY